MAQEPRRPQRSRFLCLQASGIRFAELAGARSSPAVQTRFANEKAATGGWGPVAACNDRTPSVRKSPRPLCRSTSLFSGASPAARSPVGYPHRAASVKRLCQLPSGEREQAPPPTAIPLQRAACRMRARADAPALPMRAAAIHRLASVFANAWCSPPTNSSARRRLPPKRSSSVLPSLTALNQASAVPAA